MSTSSTNSTSNTNSATTPHRPVDATDATFESLLREAGDRPVLVDFWAPWCAPCRMMSPVLTAIAAELSDDVRILKLNTDEEPGVASALGIRALPTMVLFQRGKVEDVFVGGTTRDRLQKAMARRIVTDAGRAA